MRNRLPATVLLLGIALFQAITLPSVGADVTEAWVHRYRHVIPGAGDRGVRIVRDPSGDVIVAGTTGESITGEDMLTIKYSGVDGTVLWQRRYNGPGNADDEVRALAVDASGNVVVAGRSPGANPWCEFYTAKYAAADGALLWEKRYGDNNDDSAEAVAVDSAGNVVMAGGFGYSSYYTAKYAAADGSLLWERRYQGGFNRALAVGIDANNNVIVTGTAGTIKYLANGAAVWTNTVSANALAVDAAGNAVVTGDVYVGGWPDYYTAKYAAANGALLWEQRDRADANGGATARAVVLDAAGNALVTGISFSQRYTVKYAAANGARLWTRTGPAGTGNIAADPVLIAMDGNGNAIVSGGSAHDYYTAKYAAANGAVMWERSYHGPGTSDDIAYGVAVDVGGNVFVTGSSYNGYNWDIYTAKYAPADGAILWQQRYNGLKRGLSDARAVAVDAVGNVFVTGGASNHRFILNQWSSSDYYTAKYAATDGALLWERRYNNSTNGDVQPTALAVDAGGNAIVAGGAGTIKYLANGTPAWTNNTPFAKAVAVDVSGNVIVTGDGSTTKYAAANGAILWQTNCPGTAPAVALDGHGNVVVAGYAPGTNFNFDCYTAKYAAADGSLLWEKRYNGSPGRFNGAVAVAVDASGNVAVTGLSAVRDTGYEDTFDYYTAKYAATNGALLWEKRYAGTGEDTRHFVQAIAVDAGGNVVVTGYSEDNHYFGPANFYTAKYAAADGGLLWERRRATGFAGGGEVGLTCVAVDAAGNAVVAGTSFSTNSYTDYYTAKYAAADGALLWEKFYNAPANGSDMVGRLVGGNWQGYPQETPARRLALGPNGQVVVAGTSSATVPSLTPSFYVSVFEFATVVYREELPLFVRSSANALILNWPTNATAFTLQSTLNLAPPVTWLDVTNPPTLVGGMFTITNAMTGSAEFFRLREP